MMKKLVFGLVLATMALTPALAQTNTADGQARKARSADGHTPKRGHVAAKPMRHDSNAVYVDGQYRGTDPDPAIRSQLGRGRPNTDLGQ